ncbi:MAG: hypothetical protein Q4F29_01215 [Lachnospiraceae bacterium]|nr:hypothetical protein [Lachnospiraceae bacterium]
MKKALKTLCLAAGVSAMTCMTAFAGTWQSNGAGWWYDNGNGTWPAACWQWIDGNNDGIAECYYFNPDGYCVMGQVTPDGYQTSGSGAWVVDGVVQTMQVYVETAEENDIYGTYEGYYVAGQGKTGITITIFDDMGEDWAEVEFYNLEGMSNAKEGSFLSKVLENEDGSYKLDADSWISRPSGYSMLDWNVKIEGKRMTGTSPSSSRYEIRCRKD